MRVQQSYLDEISSNNVSFAIDVSICKFIWINFYINSSDCKANFNAVRISLLSEITHSFSLGTQVSLVGSTLATVFIDWLVIINNIILFLIITASFC